MVSAIDFSLFKDLFQNMIYFNVTWVMNLAATAISLLVLTRDKNEWKKLALPMMIYWQILGLHPFFGFYVLAGIIFVLEYLSLATISELVKNVRITRSIESIQRNKLRIAERQDVVKRGFKEKYYGRKLTHKDALGQMTMAQKLQTYARDLKDKTKLTAMERKEKVNQYNQELKHERKIREMKHKEGLPHYEREVRRKITQGEIKKRLATDASMGKRLRTMMGFADKRRGEGKDTRVFVEGYGKKLKDVFITQDQIERKHALRRSKGKIIPLPSKSAPKPKTFGTGSTIRLPRGRNVISLGSKRKELTWKRSVINLPRTTGTPKQSIIPLKYKRRKKKWLEQLKYKGK